MSCLVNLHEVAAIIREAAREELLPRFQDGITAQSARRKADGDLVTEADLACERRLIQALGELLPEARIVSEESFGSMSLCEPGHTWIIDPLDGTGNFAAGGGAFGVCVALAHGHTIAAGWLYEPLTGRAAQGARDMHHLALSPSPEPDARNWAAVLATGDFDTDHHAQVTRARGQFRATRPTLSCVTDYLDLLEGVVDVALYRRTLPWDHAAGVFLHGLAGGHHRCFDGGAYRWPLRNQGLLLAPSAEVLERVALGLLPTIPSP